MGPCRSGRPDFCSTGEFVERGISGVHGFMTEYVVEDERWLVPVPFPLREVGGIDLVYEAVGLSRLAFEVMAHMGRNGIFLFTGVAALRGPQPVDTDTLMRNLVLENQVALGTVNAGRDAFEAAVRDLEAFVDRWPQAIRQVITGRYPIDAYRDLLLGRPGGIKNLIALAS